MLPALLIGFVLAFLGSMPIAGPIAVIVVSKGLDKKPREGFFIALGAGLAEAVYAGLAFLGLTAMLERYPLLVPISRLFGCVILVGLGVYFLVRPSKADEPREKKEEKKGTSTALGAAFLGLSVTALNPTLIVTWTAAVSAAESTGFLRVKEIDALPFAGGVALGIVSWFATLLRLLGRFEKKFGPSSVDRVIRVMGVILVLAGIGFGVRTIVRWHAGI